MLEHSYKLFKYEYSNQNEVFNYIEYSYWNTHTKWLGMNIQTGMKCLGMNIHTRTKCLDMNIDIGTLKS
jgi:hypothetical protein